MNGEELRALETRRARVIAAIEAFFAEQGDGRTARFLSAKDRNRLVVWEVWAERYRVPLVYVASLLLTIYCGLRRSGGRRRGLPVRVVTLVSKATERILKECVERDFASGENWTVWRQQQQEKIVRERVMEEEGEEPGRGRTLMEFETVEEYVEYYGRRVGRTRDRYQAIQTECRNSPKKYRGSPWI